METIGERLKKYREEKKLTQSQLADLLEITPSLVSKFENGKRLPQDSTLVRICKLFNEDVKDSKILNLAFSKSSNGGMNTRLQIPSMWLDVLGLNQESKAILVNLEENQIKIKPLCANVGDAVEIELKNGRFRYGEIKEIKKDTIEIYILNTPVPNSEVDSIPVISIKNVFVLDEDYHEEDEYDEDYRCDK